MQSCLKGFAAIGLSMIGTASFAADETSGPAWLFVQTASEFSVDGDTLTMPYEREIFAFTDRPYRMHDYLNAHELESLWHAGSDDFSENPPNAVITWVSGEEMREAEIELMSVSVDELGRSISYNFIFEAGDDMPPAGSVVSLFIDGAYTG